MDRFRGSISLKLLMIGLIIVLLNACGSGKGSGDGQTLDSPNIDSDIQVGQETGQPATNDTKTEDGASETTGTQAAEDTATDSGTASPAGQLGLETSQEELGSYVDEHGFIRIKEHPIRRVKVQDTGNITVANFGDSVVNVETEEAIHPNSEQYIQDAYTFFTTGLAPEETYKTWNEASNTERALVKVLFLSREGLLILEEAQRTNDFTSESARNSLRFFQEASSLDSWLPSGITSSDTIMFTKYDTLTKPAWAKLAAIQDPAAQPEAFAAAYQEARAETNNIMGLLNIFLSPNAQERLDKLDNGSK
ncbi:MULTISPECIES: hypothetical protein [Paenibacillus]|uniref:hypothetical protein n=1 Tax=Paenibacillus TaxID=44249 RepID=UPI0012DD6BC9|nr:hypothetical protein [Paenibacillus massiliensis]